MALTYFLTAGQRNILSLDRWKDPAIINLFKEAKEIVRRNAEAEDRKIEALRTICEATNQQFSKIIRDMESQPDRAMAYAKAGYEYTSRLKRKYDEMAEQSDDQPDGRTTRTHPAYQGQPEDEVGERRPHQLCRQIYCQLAGQDELVELL